MYQNLIYENQQGVARITLNRPEVYHALNQALIAEITKAVTAAANDEVARVVVITGSGEKAFCSGADLKEAVESGKNANTTVAADTLKDYYEPMINSIRSIPKPV